jgi:hypothetical protein
MAEAFGRVSRQVKHIVESIFRKQSLDKAGIADGTLDKYGVSIDVLLESAREIVENNHAIPSRH